MRKISAIMAMCAATAFAAGQMPIEQQLPVSFGITSKGTYKLDGRFLDARIYSRAISDAEAAAYSTAAAGAASIARNGLVWEGVPTPGDRCDAVKKVDYSKCVNPAFPSEWCCKTRGRFGIMYGN